MKTSSAVSPLDSPQDAPRRVVALGGGTGLPAVLRGLRSRVSRNDVAALTAIVTMSDDGGSSGRLRNAMGLPPPGDVRNCLVALSDEEDLLAGLFQHRYGSSRELRGHSVGNLILAALAEQTGSFLKAVEVSSRVLRTRGRILPATQDAVRLEAVLEDGSRVAGETAIEACAKRIRRISLRPRSARPTSGVIEAILEADLVVLGPGSLYTSLVPNIVVDGVADALRRTTGVVVLVANLVGERGAAAQLDLTDHFAVVEEHAGGPIVNVVLVNDSPVEKEIAARYRAEGVSPLYWPAQRRDVLVVRKSLLAKGPKLRHDSFATAEGLIVAWASFNAKTSPVEKHERTQPVRYPIRPSRGDTMTSHQHRITDSSQADIRRSPRSEEILTSREAQELLKIGRTKLWELTRTSLIPAYRLGSGKRSSLRYKRSELLAWLDRNRI